jgi:hypothetical protein
LIAFWKYPIFRDVLVGCGVNHGNPNELLEGGVKSVTEEAVYERG